MIEEGQFTLCAAFLAHEGKFEAVKALCLESLALTQAAVGVQQALCLEPSKPEKPFVFISIWRSEADFQAFLQTQPMRAFHSKTAVQQMFETAMQEAKADFYTVVSAWVKPH